MKFLLVLVSLIVSSIAYAEEEKLVVVEEPYNGFAFYLAPSAIGGDVGYLLRFGSPPMLEHRTSFGLQFAQYLHQQDPSSTSSSFYRFDLVFSNRIYSIKNVSINFNTDILYMFSPELTGSDSTFGLHYATGAEVFTSKRVSLNTELGWSFPFTIFNATKKNFNFGKGITLNLGVKFYL